VLLLAVEDDPHPPAGGAGADGVHRAEDVREVLALVVGAAAPHDHHVLQGAVVERARVDRPGVEEIRGPERLALHTLPLPPCHVPGGLDVVVAIQEQRRRSLRSR